MEQTESVGSDSEAIETIEQATDTPVTEAVRTRLDPRSGKPVALQPASFWREHDERRRAHGQSIKQYCEEHGLALSTFRRWSCRFSGQGRSMREGIAGGGVPNGSEGFLSVPIHSSGSDDRGSARPAAAIEVQMRNGLKVWLHGAPADRAIEVVMAELVAQP